MITKLIHRLRQAQLELTPIEVAEMLLLSQFMPLTEVIAEKNEEEESTPDIHPETTLKSDLPAAPPAQAAPMPERSRKLKTGDVVLPSSESKSGAGSPVTAAPFRTPKARALPGVAKISQALRPLRRRYPSPRRQVIDEERTVQLIADGGPKTFVMRPAMERRLEIALVVDESVSMHVWRPTLREFRRLLERHGAFSRVRLWQLNADEPAPKLFRQTAKQRIACQPHELPAPDGRRLIIVVSDCTSPAWYLGRAYQMLVEWARSAPTVLVQVLPRRFWLGTSLAEVGATLRATAPGLPNLRLQVAPDEERKLVAEGGVAIPVVTLDEWSIAPWAQVLAGVGHAVATGMVIPDLTDAIKSFQPPPNAKPSSEEQEKTAEELVRDFRAYASPLAQELAAYLAAVPLSLPVMQLVQQVMLAQSRQSHLAEIFRSELVRMPAVMPGEPFSDEAIFDFRDQQVRDLLLDEVSQRKALRVLSEVSDFIESRLGQASEFGALIAMPAEQSVGERRVDPLALSFARLGARTLRRFGVHEQQAAEWEDYVRWAEEESPESSPETDPENQTALLAELLNRHIAPNTERFGEARETIGKHVDELLIAASVGDQQKALQSLNDLAVNLLDIGQLDAAQEFYIHLEWQAVRYDFQQYLFEAKVGLGRIEMARQNWGLASDYFGEAWGIADRSGDPVWQGEAMAKLARIEFNRGNLGVTISVAEAALKVTKDQSLEASMCKLLGETYLQNLIEPVFAVPENERDEHLARAEDFINRAVTLYRQLDDKQGVGEALFGLGRLHTLSKKFATAIEFYQQALNDFESFGQHLGVAAVNGALADVYTKLNAHRSAIECYEQALAIWRELGDQFNQARTLDSMSHLWHSLGDNVKAIASAEEGLKLYDFLPTSSTQEFAISLSNHLIEWSRMPFALTAFTFQTITLDARGKVVKRESKQARQFEEELGGGVKLAMVEIPGGKFMMGAPKNEKDSYDDERPQHEVTVQPFYIGKFTITQAQWRAAAGLKKIEIDLKPEPTKFKGDDRPVEQISWHEAKEFCARLSKQTGRLYRLPSEAEWEYACRAGTTTPFAFGEAITPEFVNYNGEYPYGKAKKGQYRKETVAVGSLGAANDFGLFDMHGNVWEWCEDARHPNYENAPADGSSWLSGKDSTSSRVVRGGSWVVDGDSCRSAGRYFGDPGLRVNHFGFRVVVAARSS